MRRLLGAMEDGDRSALDELFPLVYEELRGLAHRERGRWRGDPTLTTTGLVHELYLKLAGGSRVTAESRAHLLALAAKAMRHILSNYVRGQRAQRRGGGARRVSLDEATLLPADDHAAAARERAELLGALEEAVERLERENPRYAAVVECRFFGGMAVPDTARALGISERTVKRDWAVAQAWLHRELTHGADHA